MHNLYKKLNRYSLKDAVDFENSEKVFTEYDKTTEKGLAMTENTKYMTLILPLIQAAKEK